MLKGIYFISAAFILLMSFPPLLNALEGSSLLNADDFLLEELDYQKGPALSSGIGDPKPWATYSRWMCFSADQVRLEQVQIKLDAGWVQWPQLKVDALGQSFDISPEVDQKLITEKVLNNWKNIIGSSREICFYAAFLQYLSSVEDEIPESLWVLEKIKTENGYWHISEADGRDENGLPEEDIGSGSLLTAKGFAAER